MTDQELDGLLGTLESFMAGNDPTAERSRKMLNITRSTGEFFDVLMRALRPSDVLEIGTSNGYSTLWLARGRSEQLPPLVTVEKSAAKFNLAAENFRRAGFGSRVDQRLGDAGEYLRDAPEDSVDFIFLDSERSEYARWWPDVKRLLRGGGVLVVDNATSHPAEIAPLLALARADPAFTTCVLPVGQGELVAVKTR